MNPRFKQALEAFNIDAQAKIVASSETFANVLYPDVEYTLTIGKWQDVENQLFWYAEQVAEQEQDCESDFPDVPKEERATAYYNEWRIDVEYHLMRFGTSVRCLGDGVYAMLT